MDRSLIQSKIQKSVTFVLETQRRLAECERVKVQSLLFESVAKRRTTTGRKCITEVLSPQPGGRIIAIIVTKNNLKAE